jgi:hypothetical protein
MIVGRLAWRHHERAARTAGGKQEKGTEKYGNKYGNAMHGWNP